MQDNSVKCEQDMVIECQGSHGITNDWWFNVDGEKRSYHVTSDPESDCICILQDTCTNLHPE